MAETISRIHGLDGRLLPRGSAFLNLLLNGCRSRFGNDWTKRRVWEGCQPPPGSPDVESITFSLPMVCITSSGGVPKSSVMMENWLT